MKKTFFLTIAIMMFGCQSENNDNISYGGVNPVFGHILQLSFQDASGKDLVKGIGYDTTNYGTQNNFGSILPELYTLNVQCEDCCYPESPPGAIYDPSPLPKLEINIVEDKYYLFFSGGIWKGKNCLDLERTITYTLTCPYVFGDDREHEMVTFWKADDLEQPDMDCYGLEFDGKEIPGVTLVFNSLYETTIVLDK